MSEEKTIIKGEQYNVKAIRNIMLIVMLIAAATTVITFSIHVSNGAIIVYALVVTVLCLIAVIIINAYTKVSMSVTDKRVYGIANFGKRVDLPLDMISAVGTSVFSSIAVTTASGAIKFGMIKNKDDVHNAISKLLIDRQGKSNTTTTIKQEIPQSNAEELKKYKELLDSGTITQAEFEAKKKQLLNL